MRLSNKIWVTAAPNAHTMPVLCVGDRGCVNFHTRRTPVDSAIPSDTWKRCSGCKMKVAAKITR